MAGPEPLSAHAAKPAAMATATLRRAAELSGSHAMTPPRGTYFVMRRPQFGRSCPGSAIVCRQSRGRAGATEPLPSAGSPGPPLAGELRAPESAPGAGGHPEGGVDAVEEVGDRDHQHQGPQ